MSGKVRMYRKLASVLTVLLVCLWSAETVLAQSTAFTYQGKPTEGGTPATGNYDMQFKLFDALTDGNQIGATVTNPTVTVASGVFTIELDFGAGAFDGTPRFLEICVRPAGDPNPYTVLSPRQPFTAIPYALHSASSGVADGLSVACINCVTSSQIQSVEGAQITGEIPVVSVPSGSGNYIQNSAAALRRGKTSLQQEAGFNIDGDGIIGGNLGIGTSTPQSPLSVFRATPGYGFTHTNGTVTVGSFLTTGSGWFGTRSNHPLNFFTNDGGAAMQIVQTGEVGIGVTPQAGIKLDVGGIGLFRTANGNIQFGSPNAETGMSISGANGRADLRFDGTLKLLNGPGGIPPATNGIAISPAGNVGVGTATPQFKLHVEAAGIVESNVRSTNERAILALDSTVAGQRKVWTLESGLFGTAGLFGIYDRTAQQARLTIDGTGAVAVKVLQIQGGGDFSENFDVSPISAATSEVKAQAVEPGLVVSIDAKNPGKLVVSRRAYDRTVAGIISGAGGISPGLVMGQKGSIADGKQPVALTGRVWAYCDAAHNPIKPGDLLTTSATPGHAMKVRNYQKAQGAIIGKAMTALKRGRGLVLVLVSLQ